MAGSNIYFASDFHLGIPDHARSLVREKKICRWLDIIKNDAAELYLMGDIFDFWFEYKSVVPKGFVRLLGKLAELSDSGIKIYNFKGNHDMWQFGYLQQEMNMILISDEHVIEHNGIKIYLHHGDGLGPGDNGYKFLKKIFNSDACQWLFGFLHPTIGTWIARNSSSKSRLSKAGTEEHYLGDDKEFLTQFCIEELKENHYDYMIFGHRHLPLDILLPNGSHYINLGEWVSQFTYAVFDGKTVELKKFEE
ncbi:MAG: UDP-2,3-diacylglucosamine diphosphatase [Bacteroidia bacterium]|nr:UDP-2,3-diacylglucosamine diphosphatase [Bacteroidia bacterium]